MLMDSPTPMAQVLGGRDLALLFVLGGMKRIEFH